MCEECVRVNEGGRAAETRVTSLANFSSQLIDALMESDGAHKALVFVDGDNDVFRVGEVSYDAVNKCIKVRLTDPYVGLRTDEIRDEIAETNK